MYTRINVVAGFSVEDYETQLEFALRPVINAAKVVVTRTSQVIIAVVVFVLAVHVASAVLRYYFRLSDTQNHTVVGPRNVYVTAHAPPVVVGGAPTDDDGAGGTLTMRLRRPIAADSTAPDGGGGGAEYDSAGEDDPDPAPAIPRRTQAPVAPSTSAQLVLRTARSTSATMCPQSSLDFKYSETKV